MGAIYTTYSQDRYIGDVTGMTEQIVKWEQGSNKFYN
jgi:hypothetical protein